MSDPSPFPVDRQTRGEPWPEGWDNPDRPNEAERAVMLSKALQAVTAALSQTGDASHAVVPSGMLCALSRRDNYDYQGGLAKAREGLRQAEEVVRRVLNELVPPRCRPSRHVGPWERIAGSDSLERCTFCGQVNGK